MGRRCGLSLAQILSTNKPQQEEGGRKIPGPLSFVEATALAEVVDKSTYISTMETLLMPMLKQASELLLP